jgi:hypothetical protein
MEHFRELLDKVDDDEKVFRPAEVTNRHGDQRVQPGFLDVETTSTGDSGVPGLGGHGGVVDGHLARGVKGQFLAGRGHVGKWDDDDDAKGKRFGVEAGGKVGGLELKTKKLKKLTGSTLSGDAEVLSAGVDANFNRKEGFKLGLSATAVQGRGQVGNSDKNFVRGGAGVGEGFGIRGHWGKNQNGDRQLGFGMDVGPVTFDVGATGVPKWAKKAGRKIKRLGRSLRDKLQL